MQIIGIVAVGKRLEIGKAGALPWHYPADLSFFRNTTSGHVVVMGFNTWLSIGKPLPNRVNVVISSRRVVENDDVVSLDSVEDVLKMFASEPGKLFIIGGSQTYAAFQSKIDEWLVTRIPEEIEGADAFMSPDFLEDFSKVSEEDLTDILKVERFVRKKETPE
jgi:dihydrofolate reductase